jgi:histidine triad (HIT) family protein
VPADCVFCRIVTTELPARVVRVDDATTAFLDMRQPRAGHVLVVPNRHVENVFELTDADGAAVMTATREVARAVRSAFEPEGLSLWQSNGAAAFQEVPHFHMHVMPRWEEDGLLRIYPQRLEQRTDRDLDAQADAIRGVLRH